MVVWYLRYKMEVSAAVFRIRIRIESGLNQVRESGIRIQEGKMSHKNVKKLINFMF
jgi:hypothetical protein